MRQASWLWWSWACTCRGGGFALDDPMCPFVRSLFSYIYVYIFFCEIMPMALNEEHLPINTNLAINKRTWLPSVISWVSTWAHPDMPSSRLPLQLQPHADTAEACRNQQDEWGLQQSAHYLVYFYMNAMSNEHAWLWFISLCSLRSPTSANHCCCMRETRVTAVLFLYVFLLYFYPV